MKRQWTKADYREQRDTVALYARALLRRIDEMTSEQFSRGEERPERENLRRILDSLPQT